MTDRIWIDKTVPGQPWRVWTIEMTDLPEYVSRDVVDDAERRAFCSGRDAAAALFHAEQVRVWAEEIMSDLALNAGMTCQTYDDKVSAFCAIHETLTEIANMIRSIAPDMGDIINGGKDD